MAKSPETAETVRSVGKDDVLRYLQQHPTFLVENAEALSALAMPSRDLGDGVIDLQQAMIGRLREKVEQTEDVARLLIDNSRDNLSTTARIHECVLALLDATSFEQLIQIATVDLAVVLDVDTVTLCVESNGAFGVPVQTLRLLPEGAVGSYLAPMQTVALNQDISADPQIFDAAAPLIASEALVRLNISSEAPPALLAFGSRDRDRFKEGQATELLQFLARVLEKLVRVWLDLPEDEEEYLA